MSEEGRVNGHRPTELIGKMGPITISTAPVESEELSFDVDRVVSAVVSLRSEIPSDAYTAPYLGTEREGSAILIDTDGLLLTIGYLLLESRAVIVEVDEGRAVPAEFVAYDYESGMGLVRATAPLDVDPMTVGSAGGLGAGDPVVIAARGGRRQAIAGAVVSRREFAGYWEYLLDDAIFTAPPHPNWSGAALLDADGVLCGLGSLLVEDAVQGESQMQGNMFVPIDLLPPLLDDIRRGTFAAKPARPWLGMFTAETLDQLVVTHVTPGGPAERGGVQSGDVIIRVNGEFVASLGNLYRRIWGLGTAGVEVPLTILRESTALELTLRSAAREDFFRTPRD